MVRRRSMALSAANASKLGPKSESTWIGLESEKTGSRRWSEAPDNDKTYFPSGAPRGSMVKDGDMGEEERLDAELAMAKRNSRDQELTLRRAS
jgi:hypothetical protein